MKQTRGIELPASFVVTVSHSDTETLQAAPVESDTLTVAEVTGTAQMQAVVALQPDPHSHAVKI